MIIPDTLAAEMLTFLQHWKKNDEAFSILVKLQAVIQEDAQRKMRENRERTGDRR